MIVILGTILFGLQIESSMWRWLFFFGVIAVAVMLIALAADIGLILDLILLTILAVLGFKTWLGL